MEEIQAQLAQVRAELSAERQRGANADNSKVEELEKQEMDLVSQLTTQQIEQKAQEQLAAPIPFAETFSISGVNLSELPVELVTLMEKLCRIDRERLVNEQKSELIAIQEQHAQDMAGALERERQLQRQNGEIQKQLEDDSAKLAQAIAERDGVVKTNHTLNDSVNDLQTKLANAAIQIDDQAKEVERLNSEIRDMRAAQAFGEKQAQKVIDITPDAVSDVQELVNQVAKIFSSSKAIGGNWHEVTYDDNTKEVVHSSELENLQSQVSPRLEDPATQESMVQPPEQYFTGVLPPVVPEVTFPSLQTPIAGLANEKSGIPTTVEDRLSQLEQRVAALESK